MGPLTLGETTICRDPSNQDYGLRVSPNIFYRDICTYVYIYICIV